VASLARRVPLAFPLAEALPFGTRGRRVYLLPVRLSACQSGPIGPRRPRRESLSKTLHNQSTQRAVAQDEWLRLRLDRDLSDHDWGQGFAHITITA
jgi:hypothetical protein